MSLMGRLSLLVFVLFIAGCASQAAVDEPPGFRGSPCRDKAGRSNRQAPIVCVDDSARNLTVSPDPVVIHDVLETDRKTPVVIHWFTTSGKGDLQVEIEPGCVEAQRCDRPGHCSARSVPRSTKRCKYDVWINDGQHDRLDPTLVVSPCCT
jgi:hypothetical protein